MGHSQTMNGQNKECRTSPSLIVQQISHIRIHSKSTCNVVLKFIFKFTTAVKLPHWSAQKEVPAENEMFAASKG